jgi:mannosyltransferase OCH1-like enzyme
MNNFEISKIIMQKTAKKQEEYIVNQIKSKIPNDWSYVNYCNGEEELFFNQNPLNEFPDIIKKWKQMPCQPHKADLFRYYYLYIYGGFFLDGDAMIYDNIENIINNNNFVTAIGLDMSTLCNGYIGTFPKNPIIYEALKYAYYIDVSKFMNNYD